jgi:hypothetical protein
MASLSYAFARLDGTVSLSNSHTKKPLWSFSIRLGHGGDNAPPSSRKFHTIYSVMNLLASTVIRRLAFSVESSTHARRPRRMTSAASYYFLRSSSRST